MQVVARPLHEIRQVGEVLLCANPNALPYASDKPESPGFQIEIARAVAAKLGVKLRIAWIVPRMRAATVDCDLLMDTIVKAGVSTPGTRLSTPYQSSGVSLAFNRAHPPVTSFKGLQAGTRVGVLMNSLASFIVSKTPATMVPFGFEDDMVQAVARGDVDAGALSPATIGYYNLTHPENRVVLVRAEDDEPELQWTVAVGMRRADEALVGAVNDAMSALMGDGSIQTIYERYGVPYRKP